MFLYINPLDSETVLTLSTNNLVHTDLALELCAWALTQGKATTSPFSIRLDDWYAELPDSERALMGAAPQKGTIATLYVPTCNDIQTSVERITYLVP